MRYRTGLRPNLLARIAICLSLKDPSIPNPDEFDQKGTEFKPNVLFGDYEPIFHGLMVMRLQKDGFEPDATRDKLRHHAHATSNKSDQIIESSKESNLNSMLRAHLNRGVYSLLPRLHDLNDLNELLIQERKT